VQTLEQRAQWRSFAHYIGFRNRTYGAWPTTTYEPLDACFRICTSDRSYNLYLGQHKAEVTASSSEIAFHEKAGRSQVDFCGSWNIVVLPPSGHCRHASIRTLEERFYFARCMLGVLVSAGAAICLSPCGSARFEWNPGQAITAVTGTRLWAFVFSLPGTVLTFVLSLFFYAAAATVVRLLLCNGSYASPLPHR
jgi:hypothetical protein